MFYGLIQWNVNDSLGLCKETEGSRQERKRWWFGLKRLSLLFAFGEAPLTNGINPITVFKTLECSFFLSYCRRNLHNTEDTQGKKSATSTPRLPYLIKRFYSSLLSLPPLLSMLDPFLPSIPILSTLISVCPECYFQRQNTIRGTAYETAIRSCYTI